MGKYVCLLRGINVGGNNKIAMADLKELFREGGFDDVTSYINSGNILFSSEETDQDELKTTIEKLIAERFQTVIPVAVISAAELEAASAHVPEWWDRDPEEKHNALFVIPPATAEEVIAAVGETRPEYERIAYYGPVIFWSAKLKFFSRTRWSKIVGTPAYASVTIRNANTFKKLVRLVK